MYIRKKEEKTAPTSAGSGCISGKAASGWQRHRLQRNHAPPRPALVHAELTRIHHVLAVLARTRSLPEPHRKPRRSWALSRTRAKGTGWGFTVWNGARRHRNTFLNWKVCLHNGYLIFLKKIFITFRKYYKKKLVRSIDQTLHCQILLFQVLPPDDVNFVKILYQVK